VNSVDRATLIDFALGRLEDAEAAALARRAEVDSEFAQTLDALRQELTTLDRVRLDALRAAPRRAPLLAVESQVAQDSEFKEDSDDADVNGNADAPVSALSPALSSDDALDDGNRDDALLPLSSSRVVKIRRVGPAYPFYADDQDASSTPTFAEEKSENSEAEQSAQVSETEPFATDAEKSQNSEAEQNAQFSETEPFATDAEKSQNSKAGQNAQSSEAEPLAIDAEKSQNSEAEQNAQFSETEPLAIDAEKSQNSEAEQNAQSSETEPLAIDAEKGENSEAEQSAQVSETEPLKQDGENSEIGPTGQDAEKSQNSEAEQNAQTSRHFKRFDFIPKFIAAASSSQGSPFVAKKARLLDADSPLVGFAEEISNADEFFETPNAVKSEPPNIGADFNVSNATRNDEAQDEKVRDAEAAESPNDGETSLPTPRSDEEERVCRVDNQRDGADFNVFDATRNDEAQDEKVRDAEAAESPNDGETSLPTPRSDEEERVCRVDNQRDGADFNVFDATRNDEAQDEKVRDAEAVESSNDGETSLSTPRSDEEERLCRVDNQRDGADFNVSDATRNDEAQDEKVRDAENVESSNDGETSLSTPRSDEEERLCRVDNQRDGADFNVSDATRNDEAQDEKVRDAEAAESSNDGETSLPTPRSDEEERLYRVDYQDNVEDFNVSNLAARRLAELLGREPTAAEREEYYWEEIDDERAAVPAEARRPSLLTTSARWATAPVVAVGRATLAFCGSGRRAILGADAFAATKPRRRRQPGKASDTMISTVAGILIATFVVFPLMRLAVREIFTTIAKSAVRKIGENVAISENAPQSDLLPFISEQLVFPRYETADPQGVGVVETPLETGTRSETPLPPADDSPLPLDPASTPPTLEPVPVGAILDVAPPTF